MLDYLSCLDCYSEKSQGPGDLNKKHVFLIVLEVGKSKIKEPADLVSDEGLLGLPRWLSSKESACKAGDTGDMGSAHLIIYCLSLFQSLGHRSRTKMLRECDKGRGCLCSSPTGQMLFLTL